MRKSLHVEDIAFRELEQGPAQRLQRRWARVPGPLLRTSVRAVAIDFENPGMGLLGIGSALVSFATWCFTIALGVYGFEVGVAAGAALLTRLFVQHVSEDQRPEYAEEEDELADAFRELVALINNMAQWALRAAVR